MTADQYLSGVLNSYMPSHKIPVVTAAWTDLNGRVSTWAKGLLLETKISGSYAKGTAIITGTDVDFFLSFSENCEDNLQALYTKTLNFIQSQYGIAKRQDVSVGTIINGLQTDVVPGKRQTAAAQDHSIYSNRKSTWTKTNIDKHIQYVRNSNFQKIIMLMKIWRTQKRLDFPSFFLELITIQSRSSSAHDLAGWFYGALNYVASEIERVRVTDPANASNIVSDVLTQDAKLVIARAAKASTGAATWGEIVHPRR